jgi:hypothetical protein
VRGKDREQGWAALMRAGPATQCRADYRRRRCLDQRGGGPAFHERRCGARGATPRARGFGSQVQNERSMKTENLIQALAADAHTPPAPLGGILSAWLLPGIAIAIGIYFMVLGLRPHLLSLAEKDPRVFFKIGLMGLLACQTVPVVLRLVRPGAQLRSVSAMLVMVPILLLAAILLELITIPEADWGHRLMGQNAMVCLKSIPLLAFAPFCALLLALRDGAPSRPALAGAAAGLLAGAIGAALYATRCPDDSPLFVATWYSIGIAIMTAAGALIGARALRW